MVERKKKTKAWLEPIDKKIVVVKRVKLRCIFDSKEKWLNRRNDKKETPRETNSKSTWKWMVGVQAFPFGKVRFQVRTVSSREGRIWINQSWSVYQKVSFQAWMIGFTSNQIGFTGWLGTTKIIFAEHHTRGSTFCFRGQKRTCEVQWKIHVDLNNIWTNSVGMFSTPSGNY